MAGNNKENTNQSSQLRGAGVKPSLPQGTRDFSADVVRKRQYILATIKTEFELYGFQPLETPALENLDTLLGKYGEEGDKLIFKILNNGLENPAKHDQASEAFQNILQGRNTPVLTERALRYDLTIPFARYVAMNQGHLTFPFKRYQIQPVWRADRPQKGRYREFYQCDADVVGSRSLLNEVEFVNLYDGVFKKLGLPDYTLSMNSRKLLTALAEACGGGANMIAITTAIDKLDKIGLENVKNELRERGLTDLQIHTVETYLSIRGSNAEKLHTIKTFFAESETGTSGIAELETILELTAVDGAASSNLQLDFTLARGLNYYTGVIFEAKAPARVKIGSIGGGGRYDDLTGLFGVPNMPGAGISFGVDRIYDVLEELQLFPQTLESGTKVLVFNTGTAESKIAYGVLKMLRQQGLASELYPEPAKPDKQFKYAEKKKITYIIREIQGDQCQVKNIRTGVQKTIARNALSNESLNF